MYLFVPCDKKSHGTEISFPIRSNCLSHPHPRAFLFVPIACHILTLEGEDVTSDWNE